MAGISVLPCCCGGDPQPCYTYLFRDEFDRADSTTIGNGWSEVAGDWSIASGRLTVSTASSVIQHIDSGQPNELIVQLTGDAGTVVDLTRRTSNDSLQFTIRFRFSGAPSGNRVQCLAGNPATASVSHECQLDLSAGVTYTLRVTGGSVFVNEQYIFLASSAFQTPSVGMEGAVIRTHSQHVGTLQIDFVQAGKRLLQNANCPPYPLCSWPIGATSGAVMAVTIAGAADSGFCTAGICGQFNGTWLLPFDAANRGESEWSNLCRWQQIYSLPIPCHPGGSTDLLLKFECQQSSLNVGVLRGDDRFSSTDFSWLRAFVGKMKSPSFSGCQNSDLILDANDSVGLLNCSVGGTTQVHLL